MISFIFNNFLASFPLNSIFFAIRRTSARCPRAEKALVPRPPTAQSTQSRTTPIPSSLEERSPRFPSLDKEAAGVVRFCTDPLFS